MSEETKFIYGTENFGYAEIVDTAGVLSFGEPKFIKHATNASMEVERSDKAIYADNKKVYSAPGRKVRSATMTVLYVPISYRVAALGAIQAANGMTTDSGRPKNHCFFFETREVDTSTSAETRTLHYLYDVLAKEPTLETETEGEEITESSLEIILEAKESAIALDEEGNPVQYGSIIRTDANAALYDSFTTQVILPTDPIPVPVP